MRPEEGRPSLHVINADGTGRRRLVSLGLDIGHEWSPDGTKLAFAGLPDHGGGGGWDIYVIDADGGDPRPLTFNETDEGSPRWSPDGHTLAFDRYDYDTHSVVGVFLMDADGSNERMLRGSEHGGATLRGRRTARRSRSVESRSMSSKLIGDQELWVVNTDGSDPHRVAQNVSCDFAWSPSGQQLVYTTETGTSETFTS